MTHGTSAIGFFLLVAATSAVLVGVVRRIALTQGVIDHPGHRSSHDIPTPRGGGLGAIVAIVGAFLALDIASGSVVVLLCILACVAVAAVGWFDDRHGLGVRTRLVVHLLGGVAVGTLALQDTAPLAAKIAVFVWWTFWTVSSINLVNFMDGINGLVASQVAIFALSLMLFGWRSGTGSAYAAAVAAACVGFLPWNFPRARIFLGDVGSGALGFLVPFLALLVMREHEINVVQAHLPLVPLFGDATLTIVQRWRRGENLTEAHRSHLYQRLAIGGYGHTRVTLLYGAAAMLGLLVAHCDGGPLSGLLVALYLAGLCVVGTVLERRLATPGI